jgi:hypothetical protein
LFPGDSEIDEIFKIFRYVLPACVSTLHEQGLSYRYRASLVITYDRADYQ